jgi:hypothetical protein
MTLHDGFLVNLIAETPISTEASTLLPTIGLTCNSCGHLVQFGLAGLGIADILEGPSVPQP